MHVHMSMHACTREHTHTYTHMDTMCAHVHSYKQTYTQIHTQSEAHTHTHTFSIDAALRHRVTPRSCSNIPKNWCNTDIASYITRLRAYYKHVTNYVSFVYMCCTFTVQFQRQHNCTYQFTHLKLASELWLWSTLISLTNLRFFFIRNINSTVAITIATSKPVITVPTMVPIWSLSSIPAKIMQNHHLAMLC